MSSKRGTFICFEGIDHSGKTTQARLASQSIPDSVILTFPDRSSVTGQLINGYLTSQGAGKSLEDHVLHLLFAANRWEKAQEIEKLLQEGKTVITDRYTYSGVAYTCAKNAAKGQTFTTEWCMACERGLVRPDVVIYFDIDVETALSRGEEGGKKQERYETAPFLTAVHDVYEKLFDDKFWIRVDASRTKEEITADVMRIIKETKEKNQSSPVNII